MKEMSVVDSGRFRRNGTCSKNNKFCMKASD